MVKNWLFDQHTIFYSIDSPNNPPLFLTVLSAKGILVQGVSSIVAGREGILALTIFLADSVSAHEIADGNNLVLQ